MDTITVNQEAMAFRSMCFQIAEVEVLGAWSAVAKAEAGRILSAAYIAGNMQDEHPEDAKRALRLALVGADQSARMDWGDGQWDNKGIAKRNRVSGGEFHSVSGGGKYAMIDYDGQFRLHSAIRIFRDDHRLSVVKNVKGHGATLSAAYLSLYAHAEGIAEACCTPDDPATAHAEARRDEKLDR